MHFVVYDLITESGMWQDFTLECDRCGGLNGRCVVQSACSVCGRKTVLMGVSTCSMEHMLLRESVSEIISKESGY